MVRGLTVYLGKEADFARFLQAVRAAHKSGRNFMMLLDHECWD
jgi:hypothetical protein